MMVMIRMTMLMMIEFPTPATVTPLYCTSYLDEWLMACVSVSIIIGCATAFGLLLLCVCIVATVFIKGRRKEYVLRVLSTRSWIKISRQSAGCSSASVYLDSRRQRTVMPHVGRTILQPQSQSISWWVRESYVINVLYCLNFLTTLDTPLVPKRDVGRIASFSYATCIRRSRYGVPVGILPQVWYGKLEWWICQVVKILV